MDRRAILGLAVAALAACHSSANVREHQVALCKDTLPTVSIPACGALIEAGGDPHAIADAYRNRGKAYRGQGKAAEAIQDYTHAIALEPAFALAYNSRGFARVTTGDLLGALADYDTAITLKPDLTVAVSNRSFAEFCLGRFAEAAADMQQLLTKAPTTTFVVIWLHMTKGHLGQEDSRELGPEIARTDSIHWPAPIARYFLGRISADSLLVLAAHPDPATNGDQRCEAQFYIGEEELLHRQAASATTRFRKTVASCPQASTEFVAARAELGRLGTGAKPPDPR